MKRGERGAAGKVLSRYLPVSTAHPGSGGEIAWIPTSCLRPPISGHLSRSVAYNVLKLPVTFKAACVPYKLSIEETGVPNHFKLWRVTGLTSTWLLFRPR